MADKNPTPAAASIAADRRSIAIEAAAQIAELAHAARKQVAELTEWGQGTVLDLFLQRIEALNDAVCSALDEGHGDTTEDLDRLVGNGRAKADDGTVVLCG